MVIWVLFTLGRIRGRITGRTLNVKPHNQFIVWSHNRMCNLFATNIIVFKDTPIFFSAF